MRFKTESGSEYEISGDRIRRTNSSASKRGDDEWIDLLVVPSVEVGRRVFIEMASLATKGPDDYGTPFSQASPVTTRITSFVTEVC